LLIGGCGAVFAYQLDLAAPFLTGPALFVTLAALMGVNTVVPTSIRNICFLLLGIGIGAGVTPDVIRAALTWPISFIMLTVVLVLTITLNGIMMRRVFGFPRDEALVASVPGLLSYVLALASDKNMDVARVSLVQTLRVLILTLIVPPMLGVFEEELRVVVAHPEPMSWLVLALLLGLAAGAAYLLQRRRIPAAFFLAGFFISGFGHITTLTPGPAPDIASWVAFAVIGTMIGSRFAGVTMAALRAALLGGVAATVLASLIALAGGVFVATLLGISPTTVFVAFAPGGLEAMIALASQLGVDSTFVAAHHVARLLILMALVPILLRGAGERPQRS